MKQNMYKVTIIQWQSWTKFSDSFILCLEKGQLMSGLRGNITFYQCFILPWGMADKSLFFEPQRLGNHYASFEML